jgi:putative ABC transport system substrate-binding protein
LACTVLTWAAPLAAEAQQAAKTPRVGVLFGGTPTTAASFNEAFTQGLRELGYVERQTIILERRYADGSGERINAIATELVRMRVDVIVAGSDSTIAAVKRQTQSIPIVMVGASDPVGTGFVASLARPGGNVTGMSRMSGELSAKRLELLREAVPHLSRVAVIWNPDVRGAVLDFKELEEPARSMRVQLQSVEVSRADDLARAFSAILNARAEALIVITPNPVTFASQGQLVSFAQRHRLPSIYGVQEYVEAGGLAAYGPSNAAAFRRAAFFVDRILKGARPGDLPVEQPTKFELVINLKTAKALGLTIPQSLLIRADQVIE